MRISSVSAISGLALSACVAHGGILSFTADSSGAFASDGGFPVAVVDVTQNSVTASPYAFVTVSLHQTVADASFPYTINGSFEYEMPGGDVLKGTYFALGVPTGPGALDVSGPFLFSGGTGVFTGATGGGSLTGLVQFTGPLSGISELHASGILVVVPEPTEYAVAAGAGLAAFSLWRRWRKVA